MAKDEAPRRDSEGRSARASSLQRVSRALADCEAQRPCGRPPAPVDRMRPGALQRTYGHTLDFSPTCHLTKQRSLDRGVGQTGTLGSRCGGSDRLSPRAHTALGSRSVACPSGVNVTSTRARRSQRPCSQPSCPPCLGPRQHPSTPAPLARAENASSTWLGGGAGRSRGQAVPLPRCGWSGQVL